MKAKMITLQVPEGKWCEGCMFLEKDYKWGVPRCRLFGEVLDCTREYGEAIDIRKCDDCPKEAQ